MIGATLTMNNHIYHSVGKKEYELSNHLGNVLSVISDRKFAKDEDNDLQIDYYQPDVLLTYDYSPFGVMLKERSFTKDVCQDTSYYLIHTDLNNTFSSGTVEGWEAEGNNTLVVSNANNMLKAKEPQGNGAGVISIKKALYLQSAIDYFVAFDYNVNGLYSGGNDGTKGIIVKVTEVATGTNTYTSAYLTGTGDNSFSFNFTASNTGAYRITIKAKRSTGTNHNFNNDKFFKVDNITITHQQITNDLVCTSYSDYRYGFNQGSEKDDEIKGAGNSYTTFFRQYDPRLGRWLTVDPVFQPWQSPYTSMDNNPIVNTDMLGNSIDVGKKKKKKTDKPKDPSKNFKYTPDQMKNGVPVFNDEQKAEMLNYEKAKKEFENENNKIDEANNIIDAKIALLEVEGMYSVNYNSETGLIDGVTFEEGKGIEDLSLEQQIIYYNIVDKDRVYKLDASKSVSNGFDAGGNNSSSISLTVLKNPNKPIVQGIIASDMVKGNLQDNAYYVILGIDINSIDKKDAKKMDFTFNVYKSALYFQYKAHPKAKKYVEDSKPLISK